MMDFVAIFKPWLMQVRGKTSYGLRGVLSMVGIGGRQPPTPPLLIYIYHGGVAK